VYGSIGYGPGKWNSDPSVRYSIADFGVAYPTPADRPLREPAAAGRAGRVRSQLIKLKNVQLDTYPDHSFDDAVPYAVKDVSSSTWGFLVGVNATF